MSVWAIQGVWLLAVASIELCVLAAVVWLATTVGRQWSSATKQLLWTAALAKPVLVIVLSLLGISFLPATGITPDRILAGVTAGLSDYAGASQPGLLSTAYLPHLLLALWLIGFGAALFVLIGGVIASNGLIRRAYESGFRLSPEFLRRLGIVAPADVDVIVTNLATSPASYGLWRCTVLLPTDWLPIQENGRIAPDDAVALRHVLEHEINHVRRRDGLHQFVLRLLATPLWFHPLAYFVIRRFIDVIEMAVDARVLSDSRIDRTQYARTLISAVRRSIPCKAAAGTWFLGRSRRTAVRALHRRLHCVLTPPGRLSQWSRAAATACAIAVLTSFPVTVVAVRSPQPAQATADYALAHGIPTHYYWQGEIFAYEQLPPLQQQQVRLAYASSDVRRTLGGNLRPVVRKLDPSLLLIDWNKAYEPAPQQQRFAGDLGGRNRIVGPIVKGFATDLPIPVPAPAP